MFQAPVLPGIAGCCEISMPWPGLLWFILKAEENTMTSMSLLSVGEANLEVRVVLRNLHPSPRLPPIPSSRDFWKCWGFSEEASAEAGQLSLLGSVPSGPCDPGLSLMRNQVPDYWGVHMAPLSSLCQLESQGAASFFSRWWGWPM
jgi:hypothetical protein